MSRSIDQSPGRLIWRDKAVGKYSVKAAYYSLCAQNEMLVNWPWKLIWSMDSNIQPLWYIGTDVLVTILQVIKNLDEDLKENF